MPLGGWYHATKHALEGWSDCLRLETAPFGIQVVLIEPGAIETEWGGLMGTQLRRFPDDSVYRPRIEALRKVMEDPQAAERRTPAAALAKVYVKARNDPPAPPALRQREAGAALDPHQEVARRRGLRIHDPPRHPLTDPSVGSARRSGMSPAANAAVAGRLRNAAGSIRFSPAN